MLTARVILGNRNTVFIKLVFLVNLRRGVKRIIRAGVEKIALVVIYVFLDVDTRCKLLALNVSFLADNVAGVVISVFL